MSADDNDDQGLDGIMRWMARSIERAIDGVDTESVADAMGIDPSATRDWIQSTGNWLRDQTAGLAGDAAARAPGPRPQPTPESRAPADAGPFFGAGPHPLDLPTEEQGLALAALTSGRWTIEPGTESLAAKGDGPAPNDALGVVRELRVRDWITALGEMTVVGSRALSRWLDAAA
jgi:hypothetical protein